MSDPTRHLLSVGGVRVLFLMAAREEYGPHLQARINPLITGIGPVEAAVETTRALTLLEQAGQLPQLVFSLGSAGSRALDHAQVYQVARVAYRDMDASALGFEKGCTPNVEEPAEIALPYHIPGIPSASLATGGSVVSGVAYEDIAQDMVDMETFATLRAARRFNLPLIGLRGISDGHSELERYEDWIEYLHIIDEKLGEALDRFFGQTQTYGLISES